MANIIWESPEDEVLAIGEVHPHRWEEYGEVMGLVPCESCGELTSVAYVRVVGQKKVCIPCSGYER